MRRVKQVLVLVVCLPHLFSSINPFQVNINNGLVILTGDLWERRAHFVSRNFIALDYKRKRVISSIQGDGILLFTSNKAHGVQSKLKLWRSADEARPNRLFEAFPGKLDCQEMVVVVRLRFVDASGFDVTAII